MMLDWQLVDPLTVFLVNSRWSWIYIIIAIAVNDHYGYLQTHNTCCLFASSVLSTNVLFSGLQVFTHLKYYPNEFLLYPKQRKGCSVSESLSVDFT